VIPARAAVQARHLHADGWTVSAIARHLGHDRKTVRIYLAGVRDPGQPRAGTTDTFGPFGIADRLNWLAKKRLTKTSSQCRMSPRSYAVRRSCG